MLHRLVGAIYNDGSSAGTHINQPFLGQDFHRFTHRCATNMKLLSQLTFGWQTITTAQFAIQNTLFDLPGHLLKHLH